MTPGLGSGPQTVQSGFARPKKGPGVYPGPLGLSTSFNRRRGSRGRTVPTRDTGLVDCGPDVGWRRRLRVHPESLGIDPDTHWNRTGDREMRLRDFGIECRVGRVRVTWVP